MGLLIASIAGVAATTGASLALWRAWRSGRLTVEVLALGEARREPDRDTPATAAWMAPERVARKFPQRLGKAARMSFSRRHSCTRSCCRWRWESWKA